MDRAITYQKLADLARAAGHGQDHDRVAQEEMRHWSRSLAEPAPDGVPAHASPPRPVASKGGYHSMTSTWAGLGLPAGRRMSGLFHPLAELFKLLE